MKVFILDDEPPAARAIEVLLNQHKGDFAIEVIGISNNAVEAIDQINELQPNVLFLDVEMPGYTGFEVLDRINIENLMVIFVTAYRDYAVEAFKANAIHYVMKPISPKAFSKCVERIAENLRHGRFNTRALTTVMDQFNEKSIAIKTIEGYEVVNCDDVVRVKSEGAYSQFLLENGKTLVQSKNLKQVGQILPNSLFKRVSRSAIVNINKVKSFSFHDGGSISLNNGEELLIGRTYQSSIFNFLRERYSV